MTFTQIASIVGAVLATGIGALGIALQWFDVQNGLALIFAGLAILGIHTSGPVAGNTRK